jgi:phosphate-selective porin
MADRRPSSPARVCVGLILPVVLCFVPRMALGQGETLAAPPIAPGAPPAPPPVAPPLPPPPPPTAIVIVPPPPALELSEPLAGWSDGTAFLRSPDNSFILFPSGRLQSDVYVFSSENKVPNNTFLIRRARLEATGWIGSFAYFYLAGDFAAGAPAGADPVAQAFLNTTDDYVAIAPLPAPYQTYFQFQMGQYDAPFTFENRISDKYFDFMERSITVRAFGIPENKQLGMMGSGYNEPRNFYYSIGLFNGDGQNFRNVDNNFDWMGRAWVAPFSFTGLQALHDVSIGGSFWTGNRTNALRLPAETTQAGFTFLNNSFTWMNGAVATPVELHQNGRLNAFAFELNVPYDHKYGARWEVVWKNQPLSADDARSQTNLVVLGGLNLDGWSTYVEGWAWLWGDDTIIGEQQGIQPYTRFKKFGVKPPRNGLMLAFRYEYLHVDISEEGDAASLTMMDPMVGITKVDAFEFGINYWHSKRFRGTFNYIHNHFSGDTSFVTGLKSKNEQEFTFRLAIAL